MHRQRWWSLWCLSVLMSPAIAEDAAPREVVARLIRHFQDDAGVKPDVRAQAVRQLTAAQQDDGQIPTAVAAALSLVSPEYAAGLQALAEEEFGRARTHFMSLLDSDNPYLAADARFLLARADLAEERHEDALAQLVDLLDRHGDDTVRPGDAWLLRGHAAAAVLNRPQARRALKRFLRNYPNATERDRSQAETLLAALEEVEFDLLTDIHAKMDYSRRQLKLAETGRPTQDVQEDVVALLTELIDELEKKAGNCKGCKSCSGGKPSGSGQGGASPGNSSGTSQAARITERAGPRSAWVDLSQRVDDPKTFNATKEALPLQYRALVEQYYRSFQPTAEDPAK